MDHFDPLGTGWGHVTVTRARALHMSHVECVCETDVLRDQ